MQSVILLFTVLLLNTVDSQNLRNSFFNQQRYGQKYIPQGQQQQRNGQQYPQQQNNFFGSIKTFQGASSVGSKFINTPTYLMNTSNGALVQLQLLQYSNPNLALPNGTTCACPQGMSCPFLTNNLPTCMFSFTTIISASNQSVQYIASNFVPTTTGIISTGNWTNVQYLNMTNKPMFIDIFVHQLGVVISQSTGNLVYYNRLVLVDMFVISLANYQVSNYGSAPNTIQTTATGQILGTTLTLTYNVQCIQNMQGPNCDLTCTQSTSNNQYAACVSSITGVQYSCTYVNNAVTACTACPNGLTQDQTACAQTNVPPVVTGVSKAFRVWTIVLGCLLGIAILFIIALVAVFIALQSKKKEVPRPRYAETRYGGEPTRPLLYQDDEEWRRGKTRATGGSVSTRTHVSDQEPSEDEYRQTNGGATIARREAHV